MPRLNKKQTPAPWVPERKPQARRKNDEPRYNTSRWRKARAIWLKHHPRCASCGRLANTVDHVTPVRLGGSFWDTDNYQSLCVPCHARKSGAEAHL